MMIRAALLRYFASVAVCQAWQANDPSVGWAQKRRPH